MVTWNCEYDQVHAAILVEVTHLNRLCSTTGLDNQRRLGENLFPHSCIQVGSGVRSVQYQDIFKPILIDIRGHNPRGL